MQAATEATEATAEIGHNQPEHSADFKALAERAKALTETGNKWINERPVFDAGTAPKANSFLEQLTKFSKKVEATRKKEKEPILQQGRDLDASFKALTEALTPIVKTMKERMTVYLKEQDRLRREEAERVRAEAERKEKEAREAARIALEAEERANAGDNVGTDTDVVGLQSDAAAKIEDAQSTAAEAEQLAQSKAKVQGDMGNARGLKTYWKATITDPDKAVNHFKRHPDVLAVVQKLADGLARSPASRHQEIPGIEIISEERV